MKRNSNIKLVTFEEWWSQIDPDKRQRAEETCADMIEIINTLYFVYLDWCWLLEYDHEDKQDILKRHKEV